MSSSSKRKPSDAPVSPPPLKRKLASGTTKGAVANFFTPTSQKPKDRTVWSERAPRNDTPATLLVAKYEPEAKEETSTNKRRKVAAFDLDSTLIATSSGKKHASDGNDWKWWHPSVPTRLKQLYNDENYRLIILSNQAGLTLHPDPKSKTPKANAAKRVSDFKTKCAAVLAQLDLPVTLYAATAKDMFRKPRPGMWHELCRDHDITDDVDLASSLFVGDAGGRVAVGATARDFSCSDRNLAHNIGVPFKTPEEFFLDEPPRVFAREFDLALHPYVEAGGTDTGEGADETPLFARKNKQDVVLFCGPPGAGKSTFYWRQLEPLGYERVNQDMLKTREKCVKTARELLQGGKSVAIGTSRPVARDEKPNAWLTTCFSRQYKRRPRHARRVGQSRQAARRPRALRVVQDAPLRLRAQRCRQGAQHNDEPRSQDGAAAARLQRLQVALPRAQSQGGLPGRDGAGVQVPWDEGGAWRVGAVLDLSLVCDYDI